LRNRYVAELIAAGVWRKLDRIWFFHPTPVETKADEFILLLFSDWRFTLAAFHEKMPNK